MYSERPHASIAGIGKWRRKMGEFVMKMGYRVRKSGGGTHRVTGCALTLMLVVLADVSGIGASASAQQPYSSYIPNAVPTATSTLFTNGTTSISPGRVAVDKAGNAFYIGHVSGLPSTLYEIPASSSVATIPKGRTPGSAGVAVEV